MKSKTFTHRKTTDSENSEQTAKNLRTESTGTKNPMDNAIEERSVTSTDVPVQDGRPRKSDCENPRLTGRLIISVEGVLRNRYDK